MKALALAAAIRNSTALLAVKRSLQQLLAPRTRLHGRRLLVNYVDGCQTIALSRVRRRRSSSVVVRRRPSSSSVVVRLFVCLAVCLLVSSFLCVFVVVAVDSSRQILAFSIAAHTSWRAKKSRGLFEELNNFCNSPAQVLRAAAEAAATAAAFANSKQKKEASEKEASEAKSEKHDTKHRQMN